MADHSEKTTYYVRRTDPKTNQQVIVECIGFEMAHAKAATGDLDRIARVVKLTGFVNCDGSFQQQHLVINAASNLLGEAFGDKGAHSRSAVGSSSLPMGVIVEIEGIFELG